MRNFFLDDENNLGNRLGINSLIALVCISILLLLSVVFYKERMLFIDAPHILFLLINNGGFHIEEHRIGSFISQVLPVIGIKLHLPIRAILILYSLSFYLFFLLVGILLVKKFRQYGMAILLGLYFTVFVSDSFYWTNNEVHQGITWMLLAFAVFNYCLEKGINQLVSIGLFAVAFYIAIWTHPLVMFPVMYLWVFFYLSKTNVKIPTTVFIICTIVLLVLSYLKYYQGAHHGYDSSKIEQVTQFNYKNLRAILSSNQMHFLLTGCIRTYPFLPLLFMSGIGILLYKRDYLIAIWAIVVAMVYVFLVCITFNGAEPGRFYMESEFMPLTIICAAPFVYYLLPVISRRAGNIVMIIIFITQLVTIVGSSQKFTDRVSLLEQMNYNMKQKGVAKIIIPDFDGEYSKKFVQNWGAPVESIIISALNNEHPQRTFIFSDSAQIQKLLNTGRDTFLGCWEKRGVSKINSNYFNIDTTSTYKLVQYQELIQSSRD